jgi:hypothetical protein
LIFKFAGMSRIGLNARHSAYSEFLASQLLSILELLQMCEISKRTGPAKNYISIKEHSTKFDLLADQPRHCLEHIVQFITNEFAAPAYSS